MGFSNHFPAQKAVDSLEALAAQMEAVNTIPTPNVSPDELDQLWGECPVGKPEDVVRKLPELPLTEHALEGHIDEKWNARNLPSYLSNCRPLELWLCPDKQKLYVLCKLAGEPPKGKTGGVVVGWKDHPAGGVMTGYAARKWNHPGCFGPMLIP